MKIHIRPIYAGVSIQDDAIEFNWDADRPEDTLKLVSDSSGVESLGDVECFYAYRFDPSASSTDKKRIRDYLKDGGSRFDEDIEQMVELGVLRFDSVQDLRTYSVLVSIDPDSSNSILHDIEVRLGSSMEISPISYHLVKCLIEDVEFDGNAAFESLMEAKPGWSESYIRKEIEFTRRKFEELKSEGSPFKIKRFIPPAIRAAFRNFLRFKTEEEKIAFESLQGVKVLAFDDFLTSGATLRELVRYLREINPSNDLSAFVLVKN